MVTQVTCSKQWQHTSGMFETMVTHKWHVRNNGNTIQWHDKIMELHNGITIPKHLK